MPVIAQPLNRFGAAPKVAEFAGAVEVGGVPNDVIVDMRFINMRGDDKGMILFQKAGSKFVAHAVGFLRCDLTGLEGLPHLIGNHIPRLCAPVIVLYSRLASTNSASTVLGSQPKEETSSPALVLSGFLA